MTVSPTPHLHAPEWLAVKFGSYYERAKPSIPQIHKREFGFGSFEKKIEFRHFAFNSQEALWAQLRKDRPLYVSASAAYYEFPAARPMAKKNWLGADLIFDLDAPAHSCAPFTCPACFSSIRQKALVLIEQFLIPDFGLSPNELHLNFSGSRGYHVRVYKKELEPLAREDRREIIDYIEGIGIDFDNFLREEPMEGTKLSRLIGPTPSDGGYPGKFARTVAALASDPASAAQISPKLKKKENADLFLSGIASGNWSKLPLPKAREKFKLIFEQNKLKLYDRVDTDVNVTIDTAKILRLPDSLHGGSGLIAKTMPYSKLPTFSPYQDALAFSMSKKESIQLLRDIPSLEFGGQTHEALAKDAVAELPEAYAVFLVCKKVALPA